MVERHGGLEITGFKGTRRKVKGAQGRVVYPVLQRGVGGREARVMAGLVRGARNLRRVRWVVVQVDLTMGGKADGGGKRSRSDAISDLVILSLADPIFFEHKSCVQMVHHSMCMWEPLESTGKRRKFLQCVGF